MQGHSFVTPCFEIANRKQNAHPSNSVSRPETNTVSNGGMEHGSFSATYNLPTLPAVWCFRNVQSSLIFKKPAILTSIHSQVRHPKVCKCIPLLVDACTWCFLCASLSVHRSICLHACHSSILSCPVCYHLSYFTPGIFIVQSFFFPYDLLDNSFESRTSIQCQAPLVHTDLDDVLFQCSPACLEQSLAAFPERIAFTIMLYVTVVVCWACCIITFITWTSSSEL